MLRNFLQSRIVKILATILIVFVVGYMLYTGARLL